MRIGLTGLMQIDLPERTLRLCDGGFFEFEGQTFRAKDEVFGTILSFEAMAEGVGDTIPALSLTLIPKDTTAAADLSRPGHQTARVRLWIAEFDVDTMEIVAASLQFDGQVDQSVLKVGRASRTLDLTVVSLMERIFEGNIGNTLNPSWHKSVWPGETGHDNATGLVLPVAWGAAASQGGGRGTGGGTRGGGARDRELFQY